MSLETILISALFAEHFRRLVRIIRIVIALIVGVAFCWVVYKAGLYIYRAIHWKSIIAAHVWLCAIVLSIMVLITGIALFRWKVTAPISYGFGEISFGILSGFTLLLHIGKDYDPTRFMGTVGSIYIISRGCSNVKDGLMSLGLFDNLWPFTPGTQNQAEDRSEGR
jgi:hypothetical protein